MGPQELRGRLGSPTHRTRVRGKSRNVHGGSNERGVGLAVKRLLICASCAVSMAAVVVAVVMAIGVELAQKAKQDAWREALAQ